MRDGLSAGQEPNLRYPIGINDHGGIRQSHWDHSIVWSETLSWVPVEQVRDVVTRKWIQTLLSHSLARRLSFFTWRTGISPPTTQNCATRLERNDTPSPHSGQRGLRTYVSHPDLRPFNVKIESRHHT